MSVVLAMLAAVVAGIGLVAGTAGAATIQSAVPAAATPTTSSTAGVLPTPSTTPTICPTSPTALIPWGTASPAVANGDTVPPTPHGGPVFTECGPTVVVSWAPATDNVGVVGYYILRNINQSEQFYRYFVTGTSFAVSHVEGHEVYTVTAVDAAGNASGLGQATTGCWSASCLPPSPSPSPSPSGGYPYGYPGNQMLTVNGSTATVSWAASGSVPVVSYLVGHQWYEVGGTVHAEFVTVPGTTTSQTLSIATPGLHTFWVSALDAAGNISPAPNTLDYGVPVPSPTVLPPTSCTVTYTINSQWPGGFHTDVKILNTGKTTVHGWRLTFTFANGQTISQIWNAVQVSNGVSPTVAHADWNPDIAGGATVSFGFIGTWTGTNSRPVEYALNGSKCSAA
ncbi:cellulose binding domain-containing protein [Microbispora sp. H10885]|uniref:cellulose binding domain-containing protein n=1 Tax=Microbispora sp. H10885 TaxID=2729110 RepID=UPI0015FF2D12|nr:cellulose binding domain-containing protein [Microbispora sp. H10885]